MIVNEVAEDIHRNAKEKGWWDEERSPAEIIALCHSELSEALECFRKGDPAEYFTKIVTDGFNGHYAQETDMTKWSKDKKTEGWATEMIDCVIRIFDFLEYKKVNISGVLWRKHEFNQTRERKHGKKF